MEVFKDLNTVELFIAFFIPGFVIVKIWEYFVPAESSDWGKRLPEVISYSSMYYAVTIWPYFLLLARYAGLAPYYVYLDIFLLPIAAGMVIVKLRGLPMRTNRGIQATPWDQFFQRVSSDPSLREGVLVDVRLKDSTQLLGYFGQKSFASTFPKPAQIYLQQLYEFDKNGAARPIVPDTGALIDCENAASISFRKWQAAQPNN